MIELLTLKVMVCHLRRRLSEFRWFLTKPRNPLTAQWSYQDPSDQQKFPMVQQLLCRVPWTSCVAIICYLLASSQLSQSVIAGCFQIGSMAAGIPSMRQPARYLFAWVLPDLTRSSRLQTHNLQVGQKTAGAGKGAGIQEDSHATWYFAAARWLGEDVRSQDALSAARVFAPGCSLLKGIFLPLSRTAS